MKRKYNTKIKKKVGGMQRIIILSIIIISACWACSVPGIPSVLADDCLISWSGYNYRYGVSKSGSVLTGETSLTEQAALAARSAIFYSCNNDPYFSDLGCNGECCTCKYSHYYISISYRVYYAGENAGKYNATEVYFSEDNLPSHTLEEEGIWNVSCDNITTTTPLPTLS
jgi:hypothetical protein